MNVYLDNAATTQVDARVVRAMTPFFSKKYGNPSSLHAFGREAREAVEEAREKIAGALNCSPQEIVFTGGGTESDNLALFGVMARAENKGKRLVSSIIEHPAVFNACKELEERGFGVDFAPVDKNAVVSLAFLEKKIKAAALVSAMHANNEVGTIQPIAEIGGACRAGGALFHCDAVQSFGKLAVDLKKLPIDLLSVSSHKIHGPKGVGALFVRTGVSLAPIVFGGGHERGLRSGTENVAGIVGFGEAAQLAASEMRSSAARMTRLRDKLINGILEIDGAFLNGHPTKRLCNNAHFRFDRIEGESLVYSLDERGIAASTGSACSSKSLEPSRVLIATGLSHVQAHGSLRLTLSKFTTPREIDYAVGVLPHVLKKLRGVTAL